MDNITKVHFNPDEDYIWDIQGLEQWDKCQKLEISGLDISNEIVEVHFSLDQFQGNAERMYGTVKDGVIHADIPEFILESPEYICSGSEVYNAYAWVYVSDEESAETIRKMEFEIKARPKPNGYASPDKQDPFLQEIRKVMNETKDIAQSVRDDADAGKFNGNASINQEALLQLAIKPTTEKSDFHHITDSANMKVVDFGMEGKTEQKTTSGKNLLDTSALVEQTINGITFTPVYTDGMLDCVLVNGTATAIAFYKMKLYNTEYLGYDLILNGCPSGGNYNTKYSFSHTVTGKCDEGNGVTLLSTANYGNNNFSIRIPSGSTVSNLKFYPMVRLATETDATYEPYTGNQPSPNPNYPQEITNAGVLNPKTGRYEIGCRVVNKNLLPNNPEKWDIGKMLYWSASKGTEVGWATRTFSAYTEIEIQPNANICFHNDTTDKYWVSRIVEIDSNRFGYSNHDLYASIAKNYVDYSFKTLSNTVKLLVEVRLVDDTQTFTEADLQEMKIAFGYGDSVSYTPHQSTEFTLTSPVPITKWDKLVKRDGVYGWSVNSIIKTFYGSENIWLYVQRENLKTIYEVLLQGVSRTWSESDESIYCNSFAYLPGNKIYTQSYTQDYVFSSVFDNKIHFASLSNEGAFESVDTFKEYLKTAGVTVVCKATTEQSFHPLPDEEQTILNNLETYYGVTNLYNDQGCPMWLTYVADTKLYTDQQIAKQIAQTQALILEN